MFQTSNPKTTSLLNLSPINYQRCYYLFGCWLVCAWRCMCCLTAFQKSCKRLKIGILTLYINWVLVCWLEHAVLNIGVCRFKHQGCCFEHQGCCFEHIWSFFLVFFTIFRMLFLTSGMLFLTYFFRVCWLEHVVWNICWLEHVVLNIWFLRFFGLQVVLVRRSSRPSSRPKNLRKLNIMIYNCLSRHSTTLHIVLSKRAHKTYPPQALRAYCFCTSCLLPGSCFWLLRNVPQQMRPKIDFKPMGWDFGITQTLNNTIKKIFLLF